VLMFSLVGVIFLIAAIVFFANSIRETDIGTVANIQATVFAAMNFVAAVISFSAAGIVRALRKN